MQEDEVSPIVGIDLGTTNSVIARIDGRHPVAVEIDGSAIVPSTVLWLDDRVIVGREARNLQLQYPERTVRSAKRKIGTDHRYSIAGREVSPEEVSAEVLRALRLGAEKALGEPVREAVITVPAYFDDAQRRATLKAGELAGLHVLRLLNEPTSASMVYEHVASLDTAARASDLVLIYDLGGGTFDVSLLEVSEGIREVRATAGNTHLGGDDFDDKLVARFLEDLKRRHGVDPREDLRAMARLTRLAEDTKISLSAVPEVQVHEEFLTTRDGKAVHLDLTVSRRDFEEEIEALLESTMELTRQVLRDAGVGAADVSRICLVGGSTRIPRVRHLLRECFASDIHDEIDPDLAVGLGAAVQAAILKSVDVDRILVDVAAHSLGIRVIGIEDEDENSVLDAPDTFAP
ncbi:MAG: Hsp70 family protein, partial [Deltaproteobacteria bacterium]